MPAREITVEHDPLVLVRLLRLLESAQRVSRSAAFERDRGNDPSDPMPRTRHVSGPRGDFTCPLDDELGLG